MVVDRCSSAFLLCLFVGSHEAQPVVAAAGALSLVLDVASHFAVVSATLLRGKQSHKDMRSSAPFLLRLYYRSRFVLGFLCASFEGFLLGSYMVSTLTAEGGEATHPNLVWGFRTFVKMCGPGAAVKTVISVLQLVNACREIVYVDEQQRRADAAAAKAASAASSPPMTRSRSPARRRSSASKAA
jgi:phosphatidylglycerophosphate synthase